MESYLKQSSCYCTRELKSHPNKLSNSQVVTVIVVLVILPPVVVTAVTLMEYPTPGTRSPIVILVVVLLIHNVEP